MTAPTLQMTPTILSETCCRIGCMDKPGDEGLCDDHRQELDALIDPPQLQVIVAIRRCLLAGITIQALADITNATTADLAAAAAGAPGRLTPIQWRRITRIALVPSLGTFRRCRALLALGVPFDEVAAEVTHGDRDYLLRLVEGTFRSVPQQIAIRAGFYYSRLERRHYTEPVAWIKARQWPVPFAWDDIEDPEEYHRVESMPPTPEIQKIARAAAKRFGSQAKAAAALRLSEDQVTIACRASGPIHESTNARLRQWGFEHEINRQIGVTK
ncbi:hypothetical protein [Corynebacterium antarcticum]|uniref:hypothetical protein n=1 Tax=Corynebacterium antarcticum TaxID=2800405 RepID=UPI0020031DA1|nr:hypothetical protein [Corynebacterium antarcticum]MCK7661985.1 hypothetical protein [Corynebacterium antarcticum]